MSEDRKSVVTWKDEDDGSQESDVDYSNTFEASVTEPIYTDTFLDASYSKTLTNEKAETASKSYTFRHGKGIKENRFHNSKFKTSENTVSFEDSERSIQDATHLETAKNETEVLETVLEVDSDLSQTQDMTTMISDTQTPDSYTAVFESTEFTETDSSYADDQTQRSSSSLSSYTESFRSDSRTKARSTIFTDDDDSLLDRSFIAPDYDGKS